MCASGHFNSYRSLRPRLAGEEAFPQNSLAMPLGATEDDFIDFAIRIFRQHRAERAIGPHGTAAMADGEEAALETVFVFD